MSVEGSDTMTEASGSHRAGEVAGGVLEARRGFADRFRASVVN